MFEFIRGKKTTETTKTTKTIEIYEYENNNEYSRRQVYPVTISVTYVPKGAFENIPHCPDQIVPGEKPIRYARVKTDCRPDDIRYKMEIKNNGTLALIKKFTEVCSDPSYLVKCVEKKDEIDALASVCAQKLLTNDAKAEYKKKIESAYTRYNQEISDRISMYEWKKSWISRNGNTMG
jgi:hypothetical protein